ncbi:MAG TPA: YeeE/YedE thiosulfate transporter family protein [Thermoanaerobaculia bacterium]|nr:YeeE/YedE thiosulfate transporter family protein [Thermoanaerobaculia bacterium]
MNAPFYKLGLFGDEISLVVAFAIGIGFGFFLEQAGFGSARKLTDQFYFRDLAVLRVMFTAIVTAMLGLFYLAWLGHVDLSLVHLAPTFLLPQIVGGLLLGIGFVVGGYCPGTSVVAAATGRLDALFNIAGILLGTLAVGTLWPWIEGFANATPMGPLTLPEVLGLSPGLVVFLVVLMALGGFRGASALERKPGGRGAEEGA